MYTTYKVPSIRIGNSQRGSPRQKSTKMWLLQLKNVLITDEVDIQCSEILRNNGIEVTADTLLAKDKNRLLKVRSH